MIRQGMTNDSILEKKFKILRTSIMLGNVRNREETMASYEETAREVDKIRRGVYEELLASKMYTTTTLEEEQERLRNLIGFIEARIKERNDFIDDYIKITSNFLDDLPKVSMESELPDFKIRLDNISEYLSNCSEIKSLNVKLKKLKEELEEKYESKANNEIIDSKLEDELIDEFNKIISRNPYYSSLNYTDIDSELAKIDSTLADKKDVMDTFVSSYEALKNAGISGAEREEYLSYVQDARLDYYSELEKKFVLNIYKLVLDKENDYDRLYQKREQIDGILRDRNECRIRLDITSRDELEYFASLCDEQFSIIKSQKFNIESIDKLILDISDCESRLESLEKANNREEIVSLLREYSLNSPEIEKIELPKEKKNNKLNKNIADESDVKLIPKANNMVVRITDPVKINVKNASDTAKLVMKKVVIVLEPKKFNNKRDKLKEAEALLEEKKQQEQLESEVKEEAKSDETFTYLDVQNNTDDTADNVFLDNSDDDNNGIVNINLDTVREDNEHLNEVKIHVPDSSDISIPTEIFIEEPKKEEKLEIFSQTDPFLDDNQFEIEDSTSKNDEIINGMPTIKNIGTVKPNNVLSQIEDATKENDDIILPTMGLTDNKVDVPIVSENYIN